MSATTMTVNVLVALGVLVVMPLGLRMLEAPGLDVVRRVWWVPAAFGLVAMWLPQGPGATALAVPYAVLTLALAGTAAARFAARPSLRPVEIAALTALATPSVAGLSLVAERAGYELFGFSLPILALTVPHLHYAGFAAALVAGLVAARAGGRWASGAALSVPAGTVLVLAGYFVSDWAELAGAAVLTAGMWIVAGLTLTDVRPTAREGWTRALLATSSGVLAVTMLLALWWAAGEAAHFPHPSIGWMVATHGVLNALGFALCAVLAWRRLAPEAPYDSQATPSPSRSSADR